MKAVTITIYPDELETLWRILETASETDSEARDLGYELLLRIDEQETA